MESQLHLPYLREIVVFLLAAAVVVPAMQQIKIDAALGFLAVGALIGPFGLGAFIDDIGLLRYVVIGDLDGVRALAELGVVFLLFMVGLELSPERLWSMRRLVFGLGASQVLVTSVVIGAIAWAWGNPPQVALVLGACLALSSTAVVVQTLIDRGTLSTRVGRTSFAILLFQDLAVVPILVLVTLLDPSATQTPWTSVVRAVLSAIAVCALIMVLGRVVLRPLFRQTTRTHSPELFMAMTLLTIIGTAAATAAAGLSMALGAFLAGLLLAETEFRHQIEVDISPFKGLLMGLFFISIGMGIDLRAVADNAFWVVASVVGLYVLKGVIVTGLARLYAVPMRVAVPMGLLLGQGGEFAFVVISIAMLLNIIPSDTAQFIVIVASLTMMITPLMAILSERGGRRLAARAAEDDLMPSGSVLTDHVISAGCGRVGRVIAHFLSATRTPYVALDLDGPQVSELRKTGEPVFYGDATHPEVLNLMGVEGAAALVITLDNPLAAARMARTIHSKWPLLPIFVRARDRRHAAQLMRFGATRAVPETAESSLQLARSVLRGVGIPISAANQIIEKVREADYALGAPDAEDPETLKTRQM